MSDGGNPGTISGGINITNTAGSGDANQNIEHLNINMGGGILQQNFKRTIEKEKDEDEVPTKKRNMEAQKQKPSDLRSGLSDQPEGMTLEQAERCCNKVENLTVKTCSEGQMERIEKMIKKGDAYKIARSGNKGYVLILNNNFHGMEHERHGAKRDVENMKKLWDKLGCKVRIKEDLTANEIRDALQKIAKWEGIKAFDFLAVFFMSHGTLKNGEDSLNGSDGEPVYVNDVLSKFDNSSCPFLHNKPKLFFFQFCRGEEIDSGVLAESMKVYETVDGDGSRLPRASDMLLSFATLKGYKAYRNHDGSWFINAIANIFAEFAHEEHVADLMTKVRLAVMNTSGYTEVQRNNQTENVPCREMSESRTLLAKKVYLMPNSDPLDE